VIPVSIYVHVFVYQTSSTKNHYALKQCIVLFNLRWHQFIQWALIHL